jgi:nitroreductase/ketosteroid isomerase-like protein
VEHLVTYRHAMPNARNIENAGLFFEGDRSLDRASLLTEECVWWNGMGRLPGAEGTTEFVGRDQIAEFLLGRGGHVRLSTGETVDRYDLTTSTFADVITIADGDYVFRQHTYRATTVGGRPYENAYGFLFHFRDDGLIDRIWEHWGTLTAWETLFRKPADAAAHAIDDVLTTTRAVRKRLDLTRPVPRELVEECLDLALQAPNGSNAQRWHWVLVDDPDVRRELARIYVAAMDDFVQRPQARDEAPARDYTTPDAQRMSASVYHLREHFHEVPVLVVPTIVPRTDRADSQLFEQASVWASIVPAIWSFMLALRSRGLGSAWTTLHLHREREAAELLGIPYDRCMQAGLFPVAYTIGAEFGRALRRPAREVSSWNRFARG